MKYSADTYLSVKGTLIFIRCPLASRKASPEIFNLRGFEMLFCTFSLRCFLTKKSISEKVKILRNTKRFFDFYSEVLA